MSFEIYIIIIAVIVAGLVLCAARSRPRKNDEEFLSCFMRDLKAGRYERK